MKNSLILTLLFFIKTSYCQDESGVIWMPSPHFIEGRNGETAKWLIVHGTAGGSSAEAIGEWFQNPISGVSTHYIVGRDGKIVQSVLEANTVKSGAIIEPGADSWWSENINPQTQAISIENVKPTTDNSDIISEEQKTSIFYLIRNIIRRNPQIRLAWADEEGGITGHFSISPHSRARCPGPFPWHELMAYLNNHEAEPECKGIIISQDNLDVNVNPRTDSPIQEENSPGDIVTIYRKVNGEIIDGNTGWFHMWNGYSPSAHINITGNSPNWCF